MPGPRLYEIRPGHPVFTIDGERIGRVRDIRGRAFKVDLPWAPDTWLPIESVVSVIPGERVTVDITADSIRDEAVERPPMGYEEFRERYGAEMDHDPEAERWPTFDPGRGGPPSASEWDEARERRRQRAPRESERPGADRRGEWGQAARGQHGGAQRSEGDWPQPDLVAQRFGTAPAPHEPQDFRGRGPRNWQRPDDRIRDDVCERLCDDPELDASEIEVDVAEGDVILRGTVETRHDKRRAEDLAYEVAGVRDVRNEIRSQTGMMLGTEDRPPFPIG